MGTLGLLIDLSWRAYPAAALALAGVVALGASIRIQIAARGHAVNEDSAPLTLVSTIRLLLLGTSLLAFGAGWLFGITWIMVLAGVIGAEELLETSIAASALKEGQRLQLTKSAISAKRP